MLTLFLTKFQVKKNRWYKTHFLAMELDARDCLIKQGAKEALQNDSRIYVGIASEHEFADFTIALRKGQL